MLVDTKSKDIIWNYLGIFFSLGIQVVWLPILIHYLPPDILGLWYVFISIGGIVELFDCGFNPTISHCITYAWSGATDLKKQDVFFSNEEKDTNYALVFGIMNTCRYLYLGIAVLAAITMICIGTVYIQRIAGAYLSVQLYMAWAIYILSVFFNIYIGYYSVVLIGIGDVFRKNKANILSKAFFLIIGSITLISGLGILGLSIAFFSSGIVLRYLCKYYLMHEHHFSDISIKYKKQTRYTIKYILSTMWFNAWRDGLVTVTAYLTGQATVLIISGFLTLYETGIYSFSLQIINVIMGIASGLFNAYLPALQSAYVTQSSDLTKKLYATAVACFYYVSIIGVLGVSFVGIPIIQFIRNDFFIDKIEFILLACSMFLMARHRISASFISTTNQLPYTFSFIFFAILSTLAIYIGLSHFHVQLIEVILIPLCIQAVYNHWKWNMVVNKKLNFNELTLFLFGSKELFIYIRTKFVKAI